MRRRRVSVEALCVGGSLDAGEIYALWLEMDFDPDTITLGHCHQAARTFVKSGHQLVAYRALEHEGSISNSPRHLRETPRYVFNAVELPSSAVFMGGRIQFCHNIQLGDSVLLHPCGAFFALADGWAVGLPSPQKWQDKLPWREPQRGARHHSGLVELGR